MQSTHHVAVWIDHQEAHVFQVDPDTFTEATVEAPHHVSRHPKSQAGDKNHPGDEPKFFREVIGALAAATEVLIVGPSLAKTHFTEFVRQHAPALKVVATETVDHPTSKQMAAYVRRHFASPATSPGA